MVVPTLTNRSFAADRKQAKAEPNRAALLFVLALGAGIVAAVAAATATGPFAGLRPPTRGVPTSHLVRTVIPVSPIDASAVFPPPAPPATVQRVVTVYDLPAPAQAHPSAGSASSKGDSAEAAGGSGSDHPRSHPSPTPPPDRGGGGGGGAPPGGSPPGDN